MSGLNSPMILLQTRCLGSCGLLTMTMSPRDRVLNNELVTNKVNKVKFNSIHDFLETVFILPAINEICSMPKISSTLIPTDSQAHLWLSIFVGDSSIFCPPLVGTGLRWQPKLCGDQSLFPHADRHNRILFF